MSDECVCPNEAHWQGPTVQADIFIAHFQFGDTAWLAGGSDVGLRWLARFLPHVEREGAHYIVPERVSFHITDGAQADGLTVLWI